MLSDKNRIKEMSRMITEIVREHFDPIIGKAQNGYMIEKFQTEEAISEQMEHGYQYYFVNKRDRRIGFLVFYSKENVMYLSKFYLYKEERGKGFSMQMLDFVIRHAQREGLSSIELNVNCNNSTIYAYESLGFKVVRTEKNDIGSDFSMDDYVYNLRI